MGKLGTKGTFNLSNCQYYSINKWIDKTKTIKIDESLTMEIESSFTTAVKNFDRLFVYGISPKKITEICGESGTGKSQLW